MSYDFFVFPAERADDLARATAVYESTRERGTLTPGSPMAELAAGLALRAPGLLTEPVVAHDRGGTVRTTWADPMGNLRTVAEVAAPLGLSVLDLQLAAVYDPRRRVEVALTTEAGPRLPFVTRRILREVVVEHIGGLRYHWVCVSRGRESYARCSRDPDGSWVVEHRDGGPGGHLAARTRYDALVEDLLWSWACDDGRWQALVDFSPVEP
jgi:hypothetical protein